MRTSTKGYLFAAVVAVWLGQIGTWPVSAQTPDEPGRPSIKITESPTAGTARNQLESVLGREVRTRVEEDVGRVVDLLADRHGRVQAAVIEFGGFLGIGTRKIAVEWSALSFVNDAKQPVVIVEMT